MFCHTKDFGHLDIWGDRLNNVSYVFIQKFLSTTDLKMNPLP